jgi:hypothetical protein
VSEIGFIAKLFMKLVTWICAFSHCNTFLHSPTSSISRGGCCGLLFLPIRKREGVYQRDQYSPSRESESDKKRISVPEAPCVYGLRIGGHFAE